MGYYLLVFGSVLQTVDRYSAANFQFLRSTHYNLDLTIDFKTNTYLARKRSMAA